MPHKLLAPLLFTTLGLALFLPSLSHPFVWDDEEQIVANQSITSPSNIPQFFFGSTFNSGGAEGLTGLYYKPLLTTTYSLLYSIGGSDPTFYHLFQLLLHLTNTLLLYYFLTRHIIPARSLLAGLLALLFLIHPVQVESVVYIAGLQEPLFMFFGLLALNSNLLKTSWDWRSVLQRNSWLPAKKGSSADERTDLIGVLAPLLLTAPLLLLSLLSKETGIIFVLLVPLQAFIFKTKNKLSSTLASLIALGTYLYLRFGVAQLPILEHNLSPINRLTLLERLPTIPAIITHYLTRLIAPIDLSISEHWVVTELTLTSFYLPLALTLTSLALALFLIKISPHRPTTLFFFFWFALALGLHLHLVPLDFTTSDRWLYLPLIGFFGFFISLLPPLNKFFSHKHWYWYLSLVAIFLTLLFVRSFLRVQDWQSGLTLYQNDIRLRPESFDLNNNLGVELYRIGQIQKAHTYFLKSTEIAPYWWTNYNNLGVTLEAFGEDEQALASYGKAIENGHYYLAYENYARLLIKTGQKEEALDFLELALESFPGNSRLQEYQAYALDLETQVLDTIHSR